ncbi:MAG: right-handed parallel beta-helix repeat-containing protein [Candidatus Eisenbacteria bacterium]
MRTCAVILAFVFLVALDAYAEVDLPVIAIHIEEHADRSCDHNLPVIDENSINSTYDGVGRIDAFVVLLRYGEAKAISFALTWPEAWGSGSWHDCSHLKIADISSPGDETSILWKDCAMDTVPLIVGWLTLTVTTPGTIEIEPEHKQGAIALADCNEIAPSMSEILLSARGGAGGVKGDDFAEITTIRNRNWYVRPDSTGDMATIDETIHKALPGDTVFVEGGTYREHLVLRKGIVILGGWDRDFKERDLDATPSIIDATGFHAGVRVMFGEDSTTVFDGFVITGASGKSGGGIALTSSSSPILRNLIIHSNTATYGGGISCRASSPTIQDVLITGNSASAGGGIYCATGASPLITNTTIAGNKSSHGGGIFATEGASPYIEKSIIAGHDDGHAVFMTDATSRVSLSCCDLWSNLPADFGGITLEPALFKDGISEDPGFADPSKMDYALTPGSPALAVEGCGRIGAKHATVPGP